jgi:hypothetical protein
MPGIGHERGKSAGVTEYWCCAFGWIKPGVNTSEVVVAIVIAPLGN